MNKQSAGILLFRYNKKELQFFLVHPGGPFWKNKDAGAWTIPKGEYGEEENPLDAARREFAEETGMKLETNSAQLIELKPVKLKNGKIIRAWAAQQDINPLEIKSNTFIIQFPNGKSGTFPEIDRGEWFSLDAAKEKVNPGQVALLEELKVKLEKG